MTRLVRIGPSGGLLLAVAFGLTACLSLHTATPTPFVPATAAIVDKPAEIGLPSGPPAVVPLQLDETGRLRGTPRLLSSPSLRPDAAERNRLRVQRADLARRQITEVIQSIRQFGDLRYLESERVDTPALCPGRGMTGDPVRHRFFSYSRNRTVDVLLCQDRVVDVQERVDVAASASIEEERDAIRIAESDPRLAPHVPGLEADALLTTTCRGALFPYRCPHRTMYVTFSAAGEEGTRYEAEVDLQERRVLRASPSGGTWTAPATPPQPAQQEQARRRQAQRDAIVLPGRHEVIEDQEAWKGWQFSYRLATGSRTGLEISEVLYQGRPVVHRMTLPVIRVRYERDTVWYKPWTWFPFDRLFSQGCGPFNDRIDAGNVEVPAGADAPDTPWPRDPEACPEKVCRREWLQDDVAWLEYGVYARIGKYHIYHAWYFSAPAGPGSKAPAQIHAAVWSGGIACNMEHVHHPYWRFDVSPAGGTTDQVFQLTSGAPAWSHYTTEGDWRRESSEPNPYLFVRRQAQPDGLWVFRSTADAVSDGFSNRDLSLRAYQAAEEGNWDLDEYQDLPYANGESVATGRAVVWYVGHMSHVVKDETQKGWKWHHSGPYLVVHPSPP
jgi:hypothetical protein